jgi:hypothetical protein
MVTLTIQNDLPGSITDISVADADISAGLKGQPVKGKPDKPIASGQSFTITYDVTADKTGTYTLGAGHRDICRFNRELPENYIRYGYPDGNLISLFF